MIDVIQKEKDKSDELLLNILPAEVAEELKEKGYIVETALGYHKRVDEIVKLVIEFNADILVMGAHGHGIFKDLLYGDTVDKVRHKLEIPVLIVS